MDFYRANHDVALTWRRFGFSRQTFYRGRRRYDLRSLAARSHCPHRRRQPSWSFPLEEKVDSELQFCLLDKTGDLR